MYSLGLFRNENAVPCNKLELLMIHFHCWGALLSKTRSSILWDHIDDRTYRKPLVLKQTICHIHTSLCRTAVSVWPAPNTIAWQGHTEGIYEFYISTWPPCLCIKMHIKCLICSWLKEVWIVLMTLQSVSLDYHHYCHCCCPKSLNSQYFF